MLISILASVLLSRFSIKMVWYLDDPISSYLLHTSIILCITIRMKKARRINYQVKRLQNIRRQRSSKRIRFMTYVKSCHHFYLFAVCYFVYVNPSVLFPPIFFNTFLYEAIKIIEASVFLHVNFFKLVFGFFPLLHFFCISLVRNIYYIHILGAINF